MNTPSAWQSRTAPVGSASFDEGLRQHMLRVYNYMGLGLGLTGVVAFLVASTPALYQPLFGTPLKWVVMLAPLAFVFFFSFRIHAISAATAQMLFWAFCALMGLSLASSSPFDLSGVSATGRAGSDSVTRAGAGRSSLIQRRHGGARPLDRRRAALL